MTCLSELDYFSNHPNCEECPRYCDDCDGDPEIIDETTMEMIPKITKNELKKRKIFYTDDLNITRGMYCKRNNTILINLGANQFINSLFLDNTDLFIELLTETITHEYIHKIIEETTFKYRSEEYEEKVCKILANQV